MKRDFAHVLRLFHDVRKVLQGEMQVEVFLCELDRHHPYTTPHVTDGRTVREILPRKLCEQ